MSRAHVHPSLQAVTLSQLGAYFDVDRPHMAVQNWAGLSLSDWDRLFSPALHLEQQQHDPGGSMDSLYAHDYLINPVSGSCNYTRRSSIFILALLTAWWGRGPPPLAAISFFCHPL
eukprot:1148973-Pelagomonas_calceolata.AAC.1